MVKISKKFQIKLLSSNVKNSKNNQNITTPVVIKIKNTWNFDNKNNDKNNQHELMINLKNLKNNSEYSDLLFKKFHRLKLTQRNPNNYDCNILEISYKNFFIKYPWKIPWFLCVISILQVHNLDVHIIIRFRYVNNILSDSIQ